MTDRQLEERVLRIEQELRRLRRSHAGLEIGAGLNRLGQDTEIDGDLTVKGTIIGGGSGGGDMLQSIYDTNHNQVVDEAESVPWSGVTGKPAVSALVNSIIPVTGWTGGAKTAGLTTIDTSALGLPAGIKKVTVRIHAQWASANPDYGVLAGTPGVEYSVCAWCPPTAWYRADVQGDVVCDANGDFNVLVVNGNPWTVSLWIVDYWV